MKSKHNKFIQPIDCFSFIVHLHSNPELFWKQKYDIFMKKHIEVIKRKFDIQKKN